MSESSRANDRYKDLRQGGCDDTHRDLKQAFVNASEAHPTLFSREACESEDDDDGSDGDSRSSSGGSDSNSDADSDSEERESEDDDDGSDGDSSSCLGGLKNNSDAEAENAYNEEDFVRSCNFCRSGRYAESTQCHFLDRFETMKKWIQQNAKDFLDVQAVISFSTKIDDHLLT
jgi:hypothetical protein